TLAAGCVERFECRVRRTSLPKRIEPSAVSVAVLVLHPLLVVVGRVPNSRWLVGIHAGPPDLRIQEPARGEHRVSNHFGLHPEARPTSKQLVMWILLDQLLGGIRALPISRGGQDHAIDRLNV